MTAADIGAWLAVLISLASAGMSAWALRYSRQSAQAAVRQAEAAEKSIPAGPPKVAWQVRRLHGAGHWELRNIGTDAVMNLVVEADGIDTAQIVIRPDADLVLPGRSVRVFVPLSMAVPSVAELRTSWDGSTAPMVVPLPGE